MNKNVAQTFTALVKKMRDPDSLPKALAPIWLELGNVPSDKWSLNNRMIRALIGGTGDARGYKQWEGVGRKVKGKEKAFYILGPCMRKTHDPVTDLDELICVGYKAIPVFGIEQTEGDPVDTGAKDYTAMIDAFPLINVAREWGLTVSARNSGSAQATYSRKGSISMAVESPAVFLHELVHAADHKRGTIKSHAGNGKSENEVVAELGSAILAEMLGVEYSLGGTARYIGSYAGKDVAKACYKVLTRTVAAVQLIMDARTGEQKA